MNPPCCIPVPEAGYDNAGLKLRQVTSAGQKALTRRRIFHVMVPFCGDSFSGKMRLWRCVPERKWVSSRTSLRVKAGERGKRGADQVTWSRVVQFPSLLSFKRLTMLQYTLKNLRRSLTNHEARLPVGHREPHCPTSHLWHAPLSGAFALVLVLFLQRVSTVVQYFST